MHNKPLLRFAPSPNGFLHLGHAYSALITDRWAHALSGNWLLRIEDIDLARSKREFVDAIFEDLHWLGLDWPTPPLHQSTQFGTYEVAAAKLDEMDVLYPCFCSRSDIQAAMNPDQLDPDGAPVYPGTCKNLTRAEIEQRQAAKTPFQMRLHMDRALEKTGLLTFSTAGPTPADRPQIRYARPQRWGDVVVVRKDTPTSYHLSVVVDDAAQNITHVTRGRDLEAATDIHVLLQFLLGFGSPLYTFHKLIEDGAQNKLSKSRGAPSLRDLKARGWAAQTVKTHLGF